MKDDDSHSLHLEGATIILASGDGSDGPVSEASLTEPQEVVWSHGRVVFSDGCSIRQIYDGRVSTLVGSPDHCVAAANETLQPVPWDSQLSRLKALASASDGTAGNSILLITSAQVLRVSLKADPCSTLTALPAGSKDTCLAHGSCGWAEGALPRETQCFSCSLLKEWADSQKPPLQECSLQFSRALTSTRYNLLGCGCEIPSTTEPPRPGKTGHASLQAFLSMIVVLIGLVATVYVYRSLRRAAAMREMYGTDTADFHTFDDDGC